MTYIPKMISANSFTAYISSTGQSYTATGDHPNYEKLLKALNNDDEKTFLLLIDIPKTINDYTKGSVKVEGGVVSYEGKPIHNVITNHILKLHANGCKFQPLVNFLEKLMANPSRRAIAEFYPWCEHHGLPITEDGDVLGYKQVRSTYLDWHSNKIDNHPGAKIPEMKRNEVNDNWGVACSEGYHIGALDYVRNFHNGEGHLMLVKFNPTNVVTVPSSETNKLRVTVYEVVKEMDGELTKPLYTNAGDPWNSSDDDWEEHEEYEDCDEEDDEFGYDEDDDCPE